MEEKSTIDRMKEHYESRLKDCKILLELEEIENEAPETTEEMRDKYGRIEEYGLSMDFADFSENEGPTNDQKSRFFRYQFSWGGPSEEIRIYNNGNIEFWFLDWGVGEHTDGSEFTEFIEKVTGLTIEEIKNKVSLFLLTGKEPKLY